MRAPQAAIAERVWLHRDAAAPHRDRRLAPVDPDDEPPTCTPAELLGDRIATQNRQRLVRARLAADHNARRRARLAELDRGVVPAERLGDPVAAAAYRRLAYEVDAFTATAPALAEQVLAVDDGHGDGKQLRARATRAPRPAAR
ncbi:hypothetical protein ACQP2F_14200 [Actinoplanes sp. CA-030573]|uniref:hypothetical protein n=1 Tax=Actinoplanes sp. CA-030573 TaxID=3239898 RepID=UPI003D914D93